MLPDRERLWARKGRRLDLDRPCPYCAEPGRLVPACPHCWQLLDREAGRVEDRIIAVLGARQAGKSHFLAALLHQLLHQEVADDLWQVTIEPQMRRTAERELLQPLFRDLRELPVTQVSSNLEIRLVLTRAGDGRRVLLRFHDLSGEAMTDPARLAKVDFLRYASGVVLLADPLAFAPPARGRRKKWHHGEPNCLQILENYRRVLQTAPRRFGQEALPLLPEEKFLAVAVTKADLVLHRSHPFWQPPQDSAHLDRGFWRSRKLESEAASEWLRGQLDAPYALDDVTALFADVSFFFSSSFGYFHQPHTAVLRKPPSPLRVHEPIFALIDRFSAGGPGRPVAPSLPGRPAPAVVADDDVL